MPLEFVAGLLLGFIDLLRMSLIIAIPAFIIFLPAERLNAFLGEKFKLSWIISAFATTFLILLPIVFALYLIPFYQGFVETPIASQIAPEAMQLTALDYAMALVATAFKNLTSTLLFAILLMPLLFFGSFAQEKIEETLKQRLGKEHKVPKPAQDFAAIFLTAFLAWLIILFAFPWIINAVFWKIYWSPI